MKSTNINEGRNEAIVRRCRVLAEYSAFIAKVRTLEKETGSLENGMIAAIKYCREHDILKEFLDRNSSEVFNMLITEWNTETALKVRYEEGMEVGIEKGIEVGREEGREEVMEATAKKALAEGLPIEVIQKITGLSPEIIKQLAIRNGSQSTTSP